MKKISLALIFTLLFSITAFATTDNTEGIEELSTYQHTFEGTISAYTSKEDGTIMSFGYDVPFTVHYDNSYKVRHDESGVISIKEVKITDDGVPVINTVVSTSYPNDGATLFGTMQYHKADGTYVTEEISVMGWIVKNGDTEITEHILGGADFDWYLRKNPDPIKSIEVWLHQ